MMANREETGCCQDILWGIIIFQVENGQLGAVAEVEFVEDGAQVVSDGSFAQTEGLGDFFVAHSLGYQGDDFQFSGADVMFFPGKVFLAGQECGEFCGDFVSVYALSGVYGFQCGNDAVVVLFQQIASGAEFQGADNVFVVQKGGQEQDLCPGTDPERISGYRYPQKTSGIQPYAQKSKSPKPSGFFHDRSSGMGTL